MKCSDATLQQWLKGIEPVRNKIGRIFLFGSRARGDFKPCSDYDLLLVMEQRDRQVIDQCYDAVMDVLLETGRLVSLKIYTGKEFERLNALKTPFMTHVAKEGIEID